MEHIKSPNEGLYTTDREHSHEEGDVNFRAILGFGIFLAVSGVIVHIALWGFYRAMETYYVRTQAPANPMVQQLQLQTAGKMDSRQNVELNRLVSTFPQPRLQVDDARDMTEFRQTEDQYLNNYVWLDKSAGKVSLPVERAMQIIAERGLPDFGTSPAATKAASSNKPSGNKGASQPPIRPPQGQR